MTLIGLMIAEYLGQRFASTWDLTLVTPLSIFGEQMDLKMRQIDFQYKKSVEKQTGRKEYK